MHEKTDTSRQNMWAANPLIAFWSIPYVMAHTWMKLCLGMGARPDAVERNSDHGQIPVPPNLQDSKDKDLFA